MSGTINMRKKFLAILLICVMTGTTLCGCESSNMTESSEKPGTVIEKTESSITIVDQAGREVTVEKNIDSIALCYRVAVRFLLSLNQGDKIKGLGKSEPFIEIIQPSIAECEDVGMGVADVEALAELNPDLFIGKATDIESLDAVEEVGIPAIGISAETPEEAMETLDILGKVCEAEDRAEELREYYDKQLNECSKLINNIDEKDKKTAIVMGSSIGKVADASMIQGEMINLAGGINCAEEMDTNELWPTAGTEQIFQWNPEYIFIGNNQSAIYSEKDLIKDKAWSEMKAVKNKNIYEIPAELDSWELPGVTSILGIYFMIHTMYPEIVSDEMLVDKADEFYELSYGRTFNREEIGY